MCKETIYKPKRRCIITEWTDGEKEESECTFHEFGFGTEEFEADLGNYAVASYSTAIVETDDGEVKNIPVENVRFIKD